MRLAALLAVVAAGASGCAGTIHTAAESGRTDAVAQFLDQGVPIDQASENGHFPLELAAVKRRPQTVKLLIDRGAPLNQRTPEGSTALDQAISQAYNSEVVGLLRKAGAKTGAEVAADKNAPAPPPPPAMTLCKILIKGDRDGAAALLDRGVDPNARVDNGYTLFNCAIQSKRADLVRLLLERGTKRAAAFESPGWGRPTDFDYAKNLGLHEIVALFTEEPRKSPGNLDDDAYDRMRASAGMPPEKREPVSDVDMPKSRAPQRPDDFALVIGIEEYQTLPKADYGVRDAQTVRRHFEALGVPARNIISLEGSQATGGKMKSYLQQWLPRNVKPESTLFVYYSGHGAPDPANGEAYLVPWDADPMFLTTSAYPLKQFYSELTALRAKRVVVALDACFSGSGGRSVLAKGARPLVAKVDESVPASANLTVLAAASGSEITGTLEDQAHGMFTYHFLKGLSGGAKTPRALLDYLKPRVQDDARRQNREQSPTLAGSGAEESF